MLVRAALHLQHEHPEITIRRDALLCSINDRLGALLLLQGDEKQWEQALDAGQEIAGLSTVYLEELILFNQANVEDVEEEAESLRSRDGRDFHD
jgi:hypothetical protein